ncbi:MAG: hypothetical protein HYX66_06935 [Ignavibacteria bacterium]|nr:hypothetical protein [Ignavibacteria bacterium]
MVDLFARRKFLIILTVSLCMLVSCTKENRIHDVYDYSHLRSDYFVRIDCRAKFRHDTLIIIDNITNTSGSNLILLPSLAFIRDPEKSRYILNRSSLGNVLYISRDSLFNVPSLWDRRIEYDPAYKYQFFVLPSDSTVEFEYRLPCRLQPLRGFLDAKFISPFFYCAWSTSDTLMGTRRVEYLRDKRAVFTVFHNGLKTFPYRDRYIFNMMTQELNGMMEVVDEDYNKLFTSRIGRLLDTSLPRAIPITR